MNEKEAASAKSLGFQKGDFVYTGSFPGIIIGDVQTSTPLVEVWGIEHEMGGVYATDLKKLTGLQFIEMAKEWGFDGRAYAKESQKALKMLSTYAKPKAKVEVQPPAQATEEPLEPGGIVHKQADAPHPAPEKPTYETPRDVPVMPQRERSRRLDKLLDEYLKAPRRKTPYLKMSPKEVKERQMRELQSKKAATMPEGFDAWYKKTPIFDILGDFSSLTPQQQKTMKAKFAADTEVGIPTDVHGKPVSIYDLASHILKRPATNGQDYEDVGLPMMGGCQTCAATIAAYNSYPSKSGYLKCLDCIGNDGWMDLETAHREIFADDTGPVKEAELASLLGDLPYVVKAAYSIDPEILPVCPWCGEESEEECQKPECVAQMEALNERLTLKQAPTDEERRQRAEVGKCPSCGCAEAGSPSTNLCGHCLRGLPCPKKQADATNKICAWCKKDMGRVEGDFGGYETHGICKHCYERELHRVKIESLLVTGNLEFRKILEKVAAHRPMVCECGHRGGGVFSDHVNDIGPGYGPCKQCDCKSFTGVQKTASQGWMSKYACPTCGGHMVHLDDYSNLYCMHQDTQLFSNKKENWTYLGRWDGTWKDLVRNSDGWVTEARPVPQVTAAQKCPKCSVDLVYYDGALGYESMVCPKCHWDVNDAKQADRSQMEEIAKAKFGKPLGSLTAKELFKVQQALGVFDKKREPALVLSKKADGAIFPWPDQQSGEMVGEAYVDKFHFELRKVPEDGGGEYWVYARFVGRNPGGEMDEQRSFEADAKREPDDAKGLGHYKGEGDLKIESSWQEEADIKGWAYDLYAELLGLDSIHGALEDEVGIRTLAAFTLAGRTGIDSRMVRLAGPKALGWAEDNFTDKYFDYLDLGKEIVVWGSSENYDPYSFLDSEVPGMWAEVLSNFDRAEARKKMAKIAEPYYNVLVAKLSKKASAWAWRCQECGHKFPNAAAAERAANSDRGCPKCGGSDIDESEAIKSAAEIIPGGKATGKPDSLYNPEELKKGIEVEKEHVEPRRDEKAEDTAKEIAKDHLEEQRQKGKSKEMQDYYKLLEKFVDPHKEHKQADSNIPFPESFRRKGPRRQRGKPEKSVLRTEAPDWLEGDVPTSKLLLEISVEEGRTSFVEDRLRSDEVIDSPFVVSIEKAYFEYGPGELVSLTEEQLQELQDDADFVARISSEYKGKTGAAILKVSPRDVCECGELASEHYKKTQDEIELSPDSGPYGKCLECLCQRFRRAGRLAKKGLKALKCENCEEDITEAQNERNKGYCDECTYEAVGEGEPNW